jgi:hypothetical protein
MQFEPRDTFPDSSPRSPDARLEVLIIYEDLAAGKKAKEVCDSLTQRLGKPWRMNLELLNFGSLHLAKQSAASFDRDLIIISCGNGKLPKSVRGWIDSFAAQPKFSGALVGLLAVTAWGPKGRRTTQSYLAAAARRRGMKFFSMTYPVGDEEPNEVLRTYDSDDSVFGPVEPRSDRSGGLST